MKTSCRILGVTIPLAVAILMSHAETATANETDLRGIDDQSPFSPNFMIELAAANRSSDPVGQLKAVYQQCKSPAEQAETELTIARVCCSRTGLVDPAESIKWYDKALVRDLPTTALAKQFILRGNMHERLGHDQLALDDYVRGLLACLQYNLPKSWPDQDGTGKLQPPPINSGIEVSDERSPARHFEESQRAADFRRESEMIRREQDLLGLRYYYIEAIKRVMKLKRLSEPDLRAIAEKLTNRKDRVDELVSRVREPNPRPWP